MHLQTRYRQSPALGAKGGCWQTSGLLHSVKLSLRNHLGENLPDGAAVLAQLLPSLLLLLLVLHSYTRAVALQLGEDRLDDASGLSQLLLVDHKRRCQADDVPAVREERREDSSSSGSSGPCAWNRSSSRWLG